MIKKPAASYEVQKSSRLMLDRLQDCKIPTLNFGTLATGKDSSAMACALFRFRTHMIVERMTDNKGTNHAIVAERCYKMVQAAASTIVTQRVIAIPATTTAQIVTLPPIPISTTNRNKEMQLLSTTWQMLAGCFRGKTIKRLLLTNYGT